jgi:uncharacterized protein (TIGR03435 family)
MLQALLTDRFHFAYHLGNKLGAIYALVGNRNGLKLSQAHDVAPDAIEAAELAGDVDAVGFFGAVKTRTSAYLNGRPSVITLSNPNMGTVRQTGEPFQMQRWEASSISLEGLADLLDKVAPVSLPIVNVTGVQGRFQMVLEVSLRDIRPGTATVNASATAHDDAETEMDAAVVSAFNEGLRKFGLKLERRKAAIGAIVVDRVEKTPTDN